MQIKTKHIVILALVLFGVGVIRLGWNRYEAVQMAEQIIAKDNAGEDTANDIEALKRFAASHMRAEVQFELTKSYERAVQEAKKTSEPQIDSELYTRAQAACAASRDPVAQSRCVSDFVAAQPKATPKPVVLPNRDSYRYSVDSPVWAPDLAGILLMSSVCLLAVLGWVKGFDLLLKP